MDEYDDIEPIAVIGMSCRFPGARSVDAFWSNLRDGVESVSFFTAAELIAAGVDPALVDNPNYIKAKASVDDIDMFDAAFFGFTPREAEILDPQHRLFLECAWTALEAAAYDPATCQSRIGVFAGAGISYYLLGNLLPNQALLESVGGLQILLGNDKDFIPTRVSYKLDLRGPSLNISTACSTSLVATHIACQSLQTYQCDMALAGGVTLHPRQKEGYLYQDEGILSPDGHCRAFDRRAQGTVGGNGVGIVVLKRLSDALADGDVIHALIRGSAINNDGSVKVGFSAPSVAGQAEVIAEAQAIAGIDPATIGYIEAHGTGTALGDPIEIEALSRVFRAAAAPPGFCAIGSVKTNIGHLDAAAGVAGLIKTVLALKHRALPPSLHFEEPNARINFADSPFRVNTDLREWPGNGTPRRAGVSSFGIGGTNAHVVLEEAPARPPSDVADSVCLLTLSARTEAALEQVTANLAQHLEHHEDLNLADVSWTLAVGRRGFQHRRFVVCRDRNEALMALRKLPATHVFTDDLRIDRPTVALMFPSRGETLGSAVQLYESKAVFRQHLDDCAERLRPHLDFDIRSVLLADPQAADFTEQHLLIAAEPALFALEYALAKLWLSWGVAPRALLGQGCGEYVAAVLAGVIGLEDALALLALKARTIGAQTPGLAFTAALPERELTSLLNQEMVLIAMDEPGQGTIAGPRAAVETLHAWLLKQGVACSGLELSPYVTSAAVESLADAFLKRLSKAELNPPQLSVAGATGGWLSPAQATDPAYWLGQLSRPTHLADSIGELLREPEQILLEVGPGNALTRHVNRHPQKQSEQRLFSSAAAEGELDTSALLMTLGHLWLNGVRVDWKGVYAPRQRQRVVLPTYPFERQRYWIEPSAPQPAPTSPATASSTSSTPPRTAMADWFYVPVWKPSPLPAEPAIDSRCCLLFCDHRGLGTQLAQQLRAAGTTVITVKAHTVFAQLAANDYYLNPQQAEDYEALLGELMRQGPILDTIVHVWSIDAEGPQSTPDTAQDLGFYSLIHLAQALGNQGYSQPCRFIVVTSQTQSVTGDERLWPDQATALGPVKVIGQEYPHLNCRYVDIDASEPTVVEHLRAEVAVAEADAAVIAYRGDGRWQQYFEPLMQRRGQAVQLRPRGVYLITGGLGGIGLTLAQYLAETVQAKLILTGRSSLPARDDWDQWLEQHPQEQPELRCKLLKLRELEVLGSDLMVVRADVTDLQQMQQVIEAAQQRFGPLHGVIHAAGIAGGGVIQFKTRDMAASVLAPKVDGVRVLNALLQDAELDFMLLCSSLTSILREFGQVDYCAANAFLDAFAHSRAGHGTTRVFALNWDGWQEVGMATPIAAAEPVAQRALRLLPDEGMKIFAETLAIAQPQLIISTRDLNPRLNSDAVSLLNRGLSSPRVAAMPTHPRPELSTAYVAPVTEAEQAIAQIWQRVLGIGQIGLHDSFFDLGGDSLVAVQAMNEINRVFDSKLSIVNLYNGLSIVSLAKALGSQPPVAPETRPRAVVSRVEPVASPPAVQQPEIATDGMIAIIGMQGRFPGAQTLDEFWRNLRAGVESVTFFSDEELLANGVDPALLADSRYIKANPVLADIEWFDASFFGYSPGEAEVMAPEQRIFMECAWTALEDAGYTPDTSGGAIGVYAGAGLNSYLYNNLYPNGNLTISPGIEKEYVATSVSYKLDLKGPSVNVQTFCSTSLVAVHMACQGLLNQECDMALAGGVAIKVPQVAGYLYQAGSILSPDGHCRAFDRRAQGTVFGSGAGVVVLKRLADALADGDNIYAVIKGSAINNDGSLRASFTAPGVEGQSQVIVKALSKAGVEAETISYVETHGTGTALGDPIEIAALSQAYRNSTEKKQFCAIGSLKTNIGHLDAAAGVAGLIKTTLALKYKELPPSLHFEHANPEIEFATTPFRVNTSLSEWRPNGAPRRAGVSSFGIGGTNAHVILEEAPPRAATAPSARPYQLLGLSARTDSALAAATANLSAHLSRNPDLDLADVAFTLQVGRRAFDKRQVVICNSTTEAISALNGAHPAQVLSATAKPDQRSLVFMFPGQGSQAVNMGLPLYQAEPAFREQMDRCASLLTPHLGFDLRERLYPPAEQAEAAAHQLSQTATTQVAVFAVEYALAKLWMSWGVQPDAMIGHSIGEYVAASLAGVLTLEDALTLVAARGRLMQSLPGGAMLAVSLPKSDIEPLLGEHLALAAVNGPTQCVVSGTTEAVTALQDRLTAYDVRCQRLQTSHAFHSAMLEPILEPFMEQARQVRLNAPAIPFLSNVSGTWIRDEEATDPAYWARHLRQTVHFADGVKTLLQDPQRVLLEVGPKRTLTTLVMRHPNRSREQLTLASLGPPDDHKTLLTALARLWLAGVPIDWLGVWSHEPRQRLSLPTYPFERQRYWIEAPDPANTPTRAHLPVQKAALGDWFYVPSWKRSALPARHEELEQTASTYLLFIDDSGLGQHLAAALEQARGTVITVKAGTEFTRLDQHRYVVNPERANDYDSLLADLHSAALTPTTVVHLWLLDRAADQDITLTQQTERAKALGFYSLLHLAQGFGKLDFLEPCKLLLITDSLQDVTGMESLRPEAATAIGPVMVIPHEFPNLSCHSIDIVAPASAAEQETLVQALLAELRLSPTDLNDPAELTVAWRGPHRWLRSYQPCYLEEPVNGASRLRKKGVYLITGGLGGIGLVLAEYLAKTLQAKLILTGRSGLPDRAEWDHWLATHDEQDGVSRRIRTVQGLQAAGAEVLVFAADITNEAAMRAVLRQAEGRFGALNGIIHTAGVPGGGVIQLKTRQMVEAVLAPKVTGALTLATMCRETQPDFLVLCSSLNAIVGEFGQVDYAAANVYLDAMSRYLHQQGMPSVCINWDSWQEVGMSVTTEVRAELQELRASNPLAITPQEGVVALCRILGSGLSHVVISTHDLLHRIEQVYRMGPDAMQEIDAGADTRPSHPRPELSNAYVRPRNDREQAIADIWQQTLGIEQIGIHDNFFEVGGDSLIGLQVVARLNKQMETQIPVVKLYERPTISAFAELCDPRPEKSAAVEQSITRGKARRQQRAQRRSRKQS